MGRRNELFTNRVIIAKSVCIEFITLNVTKYMLGATVI